MVKKKVNYQHFGKDNPRWVSKNPSYGSVHNWLNRNFQKPKSCEHCPSNRFLEWALKKGRKHDHIRSNYLCLCSSCHKKYDYTDKRKKKLSRTLKGRKMSKEWCKKISSAHIKSGHKPSKEAVLASIKYQKLHPRKRNKKGQYV